MANELPPLIVDVFSVVHLCRSTSDKLLQDLDSAECPSKPDSIPEYVHHIVFILSPSCTVSCLGLTDDHSTALFFWHWAMLQHQAFASSLVWCFQQGVYQPHISCLTYLSSNLEMKKTFFHSILFKANKFYHFGNHFSAKYQGPWKKWWSPQRLVWICLHLWHRLMWVESPLWWNVSRLLVPPLNGNTS